MLKLTGGVTEFGWILFSSGVISSRMTILTLSKESINSRLEKAILKLCTRFSRMVNGSCTLIASSMWTSRGPEHMRRKPIQRKSILICHDWTLRAPLLLELFVWCMCIMWVVKRQTIFKRIQRRGNRRQEPSASASHATLLQASASSRGPSQDRHQQRSATAAVPSISATGLGVIARSELGNGGGIRHEPDGLPVQSRRRPSDGSRRRRDQRRRQWRRPSFLDHQRHVHLMFMIDWHGSHCSSTWASQAWGRQGTRPGPSATLSGLRHHRGGGPEAQCVRGVIQ